MSRFEETLREVKALSELAEDWNSGGELPIAQSAIDAAVEFIEALDSKLPVELNGDITPSVSPSTNKDVHLTWNLSSYCFTLEFEPILSDKIEITLAVKRFGKSERWAVVSKTHAVKYVIDALKGEPR
jgi:hypothetical protein